MSLPKVSCFMSTYGRPHCVEESLRSFLLQDYPGPKELVILNDFFPQSLIFDHPEVRIVNSERILPLGRKFNENVRLCTGDIVAVWEDDDIFLPWRLSITVKRMRGEVFHTNQGFHEEGPGRLGRTRNLFHSNLAMTRKMWERFPYAEIDRSDMDVELFERLRCALGPVSQELDPEEVFYIYRWGSTESFHGSWWGGHRPMSGMAGTYMSDRLSRGLVPIGDIHLSPSWKYDYVAAAKGSK